MYVVQTFFGKLTKKNVYIFMNKTSWDTKRTLSKQ